jgi:4-amino-4-deoxy-L-arabinose transferase-like glycosyltransferase
MIATATREVAAILFGFGFTVALACALGRWFLCQAGAWDLLARLERPVFAFATGAAWLSAVVFALCVAQLVYWPVFLVLGLALLALAIRRSRGAAPAPELKPAAPGLSLWCLAPLAAVYGYLYFVHSLAPETSPDGSGYHLGLVWRYLRERGFSRITTDMYAMLSQGAEMLFLFAFAFGRHSAAKLVHFATLVATVAAVLAFGRRFQMPGGALGPAAVAAVFYVCSPVVGADAAAAYNDCLLALFTFLTFYLLLLWEELRSPALWPALGLTAGFCFAIKYTGFLVLPFALGFLLWRGGASRWRAVFSISAWAGVFIAPWLVKNAVIVGNPLAPFFNRLFPNPYLHVSFEDTYKFFMRHYNGLGEHNWSDYLDVPWELAVAGSKLQGLLGPLFLAAPLGLFCLRRSLGRRLWFAAVLFALPWLSNIGTRFLIPALLFLSLSMALAIWELPRRAALPLAALLVAGHAVGSWPSVIDRWNKQLVWRLGPAPWRAALRLEPESEYLSRVSPGYNVARMIEQAVPAGERILTAEGPPEAYTSREVLVSYRCAECAVLFDHVLTAALRDYGPVRNLRFDWPARDVSALRLVQTGSDGLEVWSMHEVLLFSGEEYLTPRPSWVIRARPNPWDGALALDGNPVTRWRSWWPLYPGMSYQIDFPQPVSLSALEVHCSPDQHQMRLRLEARDPSGHWRPLDATERRLEQEPSRDGFGRLATVELKSRGVRYILTDVGGGGLNLIGPLLARDPAAWGLQEAASYGPVRLYRIE